MMARASTDMGNVSQTLPAIHPYIGIDSLPAVNHQPEFAAATITAAAETAIAQGARHPGRHSRGCRLPTRHPSPAADRGVNVVPFDQPAVRIEHDLLGDQEVPADAYYGVHTVRAVETFPSAVYPSRGTVTLWPPPPR